MDPPGGGPPSPGLSAPLLGGRRLGGIGAARAPRCAVLWAPLLAAAAVAAAGLALAPSAGAQPLSVAPGEPEPRSETPSAAQASAVADPAGELAPGRSRRLSNGRSRSRWAFVGEAVWARKAPKPSARRVKRLGLYVKGTNSPELVLALRERRSLNGELWVKVRLPMRPNNRTGWVPREALEGYRLTTTRLVIDTRGLRATLFRRGRRVWSSAIGVGQRRWPTPRGRFYVRERLVIPRGRIRGLYGPFAFGTSAHSNTLRGGNWGEGVIGVHGTSSPELIPGRISHGCVRVPNTKIQHLRQLMGLGTPIHIR